MGPCIWVGTIAAVVRHKDVAQYRALLLVNVGQWIVQASPTLWVNYNEDMLAGNYMAATTDYTPW